MGGACSLPKKKGRNQKSGDYKKYRHSEIGAVGKNCSEMMTMDTGEQKMIGGMREDHRPDGDTAKSIQTWNPPLSSG